MASRDGKVLLIKICAHETVDVVPSARGGLDLVGLSRLTSSRKGRDISQSHPLVAALTSSVGALANLARR